jgi:hypothetical protein
MMVLEFDEGNNVLRATIDGDLTDAILLDAYAEMARCGAARPGCCGITDMTGVTRFDVSSETMSRLAKARPQSRTARCGFWSPRRLPSTGCCACFRYLVKRLDRICT